MGSIDSDEFRASTSDVIPTPNRNRKSLLRSFRFTCKVNRKLLSATISPPYRPIYTRMGSIDSDEFRASTSDVIPTPNRNRKSLLRSFRFTCKVNGKLLSATISPQIVRFTRGWARSTRTNSGHRPVTSYRHRTGTGSRYYARSDLHAKSMGKLLSATISPHIVRFTRGWARSTRTNSGHRPVTSYRHRTGTGSRYYARSDLHAKSIGNCFRLLFHPISSDLHADGLDRLGRIPGIDQ
jgi:hypothetical protein